MKAVFTALLATGALLLLGGCATVQAPESWTKPIPPKASPLSEVERPWEALAIRHIDGKLFPVAIPEKWYRWQFPLVPVKEPESKEIVPLQRLTSRTLLFCGGNWIGSSAVVYRDRYDVLVPQPCKDGDRGLIVSGSGKHVLTFAGEIVRDARVDLILGDTRHREQFFSSHASTVRNSRVGTFPLEVTRQMNQVMVADGVRYRIGFETLLAVTITVGSSIGERFLDCGGGDFNVIGTAMNPSTALIKGGVALLCAASGQPTGLFLPDDFDKKLSTTATRGERTAP